MNQVSIRPANIKDLQILLEFEQGVIKAEKPLDPFLAEGKLFYYNIPELISDENTQLLVATIKDIPVASGYVRLEKSKVYHKNSTHGYIGFIFVKEKYRGQKISSLILSDLKKWAKQNNTNELRLDVYSNNKAAIKAYERFGFTKSLVNMRTEI
ncbi:GNAT family N-acetyltransferase [uncultured Polaribacter sp.]|uniref:GNAT family N-acetyltransferase n=1 Tax=uncultured Polaribacter sp. TaxID=174711 RepID=UPI002619BFEC|nr:GNAT family N-acetyltransferase [uncultured Polaribacter sp.]